MGDRRQTGDCHVAETIDARGQWCPVPATWAKAAMDRLRAGDVLAVWTTDPLAPMDLAVLCERLGHELLDTVEKDEGQLTTLRVVAKT